MNVKELMIGDWVRYKESKKPHQIKYYQELDGIITLDFEPLSLTSGILEKNGFKYVKSQFGTYSEDCVWCIENDNEQHRVELEYQDSDTFDYFILTMEKGDNVMFFYLSKVHQLQHAFKLFGVDKKIEL